MVARFISCSHLGPKWPNVTHHLWFIRIPFEPVTWDPPCYTTIHTVFGFMFVTEWRSPGLDNIACGPSCRTSDMIYNLHIEHVFPHFHSFTHSLRSFVRSFSNSSISFHSCYVVCRPIIGIWICQLCSTRRC